jgi:hypothetical protein
MTDKINESGRSYRHIVDAIETLRANSPYNGVSLKDDEMGRREKEMQDRILALLIHETVNVCSREDFERLVEIVHNSFESHIPLYIQKRWMGRIFEISYGPRRSSYVRRSDGGDSVSKDSASPESITSLMESLGRLSKSRVSGVLEGRRSTDKSGK